MSSNASPLPDARRGPLQIGHTNNSSKRLSIGRSSRETFALEQALRHDVQQHSRFAAVERRTDGYIPMPPIGQACTFYGILLGHEHRPVVGKHDVFASQA